MLDTIFSWNTLWVLMWILYLPACIGLIIIVLLQKGKSSGFAGAFGVGGGSETVFGPRARKSLPVKATYAMAAIFMILAMSMSLVAGRVHRGAAPEVVEVEDVTSPEAIFDNLLGGESQAEAPGGTPSIALPLDPDALAASPDQPMAESPAVDAPAAEASDATAPEEAAAEPARETTEEGAASAN